MRLRKDPNKQAWTVEAQTDEEGAFLALILDALVLKFPPNKPLGVNVAQHECSDEECPVCARLIDEPLPPGYDGMAEHFPEISDADDQGRKEGEDDPVGKMW